MYLTSRKTYRRIMRDPGESVIVVITTNISEERCNVDYVTYSKKDPKEVVSGMAR
jgi:hypothetical protein